MVFQIMKDLSIGADLALQIASTEAGAAKFQRGTQGQTEGTQVQIFIVHK
jgi:hypothetical protein